MKSIIGLLFFFTVGIVTMTAQEHDGIRWKSWSELELAYNQEPRPVLLFFHAEWCAYCKKIDREIFTKSNVIDEINDEYYAVRMDVETTDTITFNHKKFVNRQALTQRNGVHEIPLMLASREGVPFSLPATVILNRQFNVKRRVFEYYTSKELMSML